MSVPTIAVTCAASDQGGESVAGGIYTAKLDQTEIYDGFVVPEQVTATADADGLAILNLWPNALGVNGSSYRITARNPDTGKKFFDASVVVPNNPCNLYQIIQNAPFPNVDSAQQALIDVQALVTITNQDVAATNADAQQAAADRLQTGEDRTAARDSAANALTSEQIVVAAHLDITTNWSDKLATAAVQAGIATTGGNTATTQAGISTTQAGLAATAKEQAELARNAMTIYGVAGYSDSVAYSANLAMTSATQIVNYLGKAYAPLLSALPFTTSGAFESAKFRLIQGVAAVDLAAPGGARMVTYFPGYGGIGLQPAGVQDVLDETVSEFRYMTEAQRNDVLSGAGLSDLTAPIQKAIDAAAYGKRLVFMPGPHRITDTLNFSDKRGVSFVGRSKGAFGASGPRMVWHGGNAKPMATFDYFKESEMENITWIGADTVANRATACLVFKKTAFSSHGPAIFRKVYVDNAEFGVMLGDQAYDDTYNVSEFTFDHCRLNARYGLYVGGVASGGQNVNQRLIGTDFGGAISERGVWLDGGNVFALMCSWNGSKSPLPYTAIYLKGDVTTGIPIVVSNSYTEQIAKFIETEYTETATEWNRGGRVILENSWLRCNRPLSGTAYLLEVYKNLEIELCNINSSEGNIIYSPPANPSFSGYSAIAPASNSLRFTGNNAILGTITAARGGYIQSSDRAIRGTFPFGFMTPAAGVLTLSAAVQKLPEYGVQIAYGSNATFDLATITGGLVGDVLHIMGHPTQATFRISNIKHGAGNIFLATGADFPINTATKKVVLKKDVTGNWLECGRITV